MLDSTGLDRVPESFLAPTTLFAAAFRTRRRKRVCSRLLPEVKIASTGCFNCLLSGDHMDSLQRDYVRNRDETRQDLKVTSVSSLYSTHRTGGKRSITSCAVAPGGQIVTRLRRVELSLAPIPENGPSTNLSASSFPVSL